MTFAVGVLVGTLVGVIATLSVLKVGDWLAWCAILPHLDAALAARDGRDLHVESVEFRTLDAMDLYLEALDRQQRTRRPRKGTH
jgi:hypothetical protein